MLVVGRHILAKWIDVTPRRINQLVDEGVLSKTRRGAYPLVDNLQAYFRYLKSQAPAGTFDYLNKPPPPEEEDEPIDDGGLSASQLAEFKKDIRALPDRKAHR